ncbi:hypothetical protein ACFV1T_24155, partial [Streptomyces vinaceus]
MTNEAPGPADPAVRAGLPVLLEAVLSVGSELELRATLQHIVDSATELCSARYAAGGGGGAAGGGGGRRPRHPRPQSGERRARPPP